jgi:hypothetical protein
MNTPPPVPPTWAQPAHARSQRWQMFALAVIALAALALAIGSWFQPLPITKAPNPLAPSYTNQQVAEAKANVCAAFQTVHQSIVVTNHREHGTDPTSALAAATSARQAFAAGGGYLLTALGNKPATPPDLAGAVRRLGTVFQQLAVSYLAELNNSALDPLLHDGDEATLTIQQLCK